MRLPRSRSIAEAAVAERVEVVHHARQVEVAVGVEAVEEALALVLEVALDREVDAEAAQRLAVVLQPPAELGAHRLLGEVGDVRDPARQREPVVGPHAVLVVVAAVEVLVLHDRRARDGAEGDVLRREPGARADHEPGAELVGVVERPLQHLHAADRAADRRERPLDAQVLQQPPVHRDEVAHGAEREAQAVRLAAGRVDRATGPVVPWQPPSRFAQTTNSRSVSSGLPGPIRLSHQPRRVGVAVVAGRVRVARQRVADEDAVGRARVELAVGLVGDLDGGQLLAGLEHERVALVPEHDPLCLDQTERALGAPRQAVDVTLRP